MSLIRDRGKCSYISSFRMVCKFVTSMNFILPYEGFQKWRYSKMDQHGWFIRENPNLKRMIEGSPVYGNPYISTINPSKLQLDQCSPTHIFPHLLRREEERTELLTALSAGRSSWHQDETMSGWWLSHPSEKYESQFCHFADERPVDWGPAFRCV